MLRGTLVCESIIDAGTFIVTEVTREGVHVQMIEEYTQYRDTLDAILVRERKRVVNGAGDRFWMGLQVLVQISRQFLPIGVFDTTGLHISRGVDWR